LGTAIVAVAAATSAVLVFGPSSWDGRPSSGVGPSPSAAASPASSSSERLTVPEVDGLSAMEAGRLLARAGLLVADAEPAPGPPGIVVGTDPPISQAVEPGTPITLYVGAPPERMTPGS
ncbi:MAG: PASTA domain-containing protein, partial [Actinomycetota bacterium]